MLLDDAERSLLGLAIRLDRHVCQHCRCVRRLGLLDGAEQVTSLAARLDAERDMEPSSLEPTRMCTDRGIRCPCRRSLITRPLDAESADLAHGRLLVLDLLAQVDKAVARAEVKVGHLQSLVLGIHAQVYQAVSRAEVKVEIDVLGGIEDVSHLEVGDHLRRLVPSRSELDRLILGRIEHCQTVLGSAMLQVLGHDRRAVSLTVCSVTIAAVVLVTVCICTELAVAAHITDQTLLGREAVVVSAHLAVRVRAKPGACATILDQTLPDTEASIIGPPRLCTTCGNRCPCSRWC